MREITTTSLPEVRTILRTMTESTMVTYGGKNSKRLVHPNGTLRLFCEGGPGQISELVEEYNGLVSGIRYGNAGIRVMDCSDKVVNLCWYENTGDSTEKMEAVAIRCFDWEGVSYMYKSMYNLEYAFIEAVINS